MLCFKLSSSQREANCAGSVSVFLQLSASVALNLRVVAALGRFVARNKFSINGRAELFMFVFVVVVGLHLHSFWATVMSFGARTQVLTADFRRYILVYILISCLCLKTN